jgi:hypothetical protein
LEGALPMRASDADMQGYPILDLAQKSLELKKYFDSIASSDFREEDRALIHYQLHEAKKLKVVIDKFKKAKFMMPMLYIDALAKLNVQLSDMEKKTNSDLAEVYYLYFKVVFSYICEIFNTKELENSREHIAAINAILITQLEKIANTFINRFEGYLKKD